MSNTSQGESAPEDSDDDENSVELDELDEEQSEGLQGRRLQLIPHSVDPRYVFRFEFGPAILAQVLEKIDNLPIAPLENVAVEAAAAYPGFYQLFRLGKSVYVGRTIRPVGQRLGEHARKLRGRIPLAEMGARFLFVEDLSLVGLSEDAMIAYLHPLGLDPWGKMGFGSKVTGFGRAGQESGWHDEFPADLTMPVSAGHVKPRTLRQLIGSIAKSAPMVLSIPKRLVPRFKEDHPESFVVELQERTFEAWVADVESRLALGWRVVRKPMAWYVVREDE